jgi:hypothetical protein
MPETNKHDVHVHGPGLGQPLRRPPDPSALASLLNQWMNEDEAEQRETFEFLRQALDEDRPAGYKLFS